MKTALKISLAANLGLVALALWLAPRARFGAGVPAAAVSSTESAAAGVAFAQSAPEEAHPEPLNNFRWSQLESPDYRTYIANLEAIGCPKQTICDIITADVDSLYAPKRRQSNEAERMRLLEEESQVISTLLGMPRSQVAASTQGDQPANTTASGENQTVSNEPVRISMPLVFANLDTNSLNLTPTQLARINGLRQRFMNEIGGTNADPDSADYAARWQRAQPEIDQSLKTQLGYQMYLQLSRQPRLSQ
jgi:hypothetical protein